MNTKLKMAIVGAGTWGENHAKIYNSHPFAQVVAVCDQNEDKAKAVASRQGIPQVYKDYKLMLNEVDCDAVAIVTPDFAHKDIAVFAANAGKHILCEKPLATKKEDVFEMLEAFEKNGTRAMVDLHNRWNPPFNTAYQSIKSGELGEVYSGYFRLNDIKWVATDLLPWAAQSSILWFLGTHSLDTLRWLFDDEVKRVYSVSRSGVLKELGIDTVDEYLTTIEFSRGGIAQMENGWITPNANMGVNDMKCNILGTKGMISIDTSHHTMIQKFTEDKARVPDVLVQNSVFGAPKGFAFESIRAFVDCIISGEDFPVSIKDAANTSLAILGIMESAKTRMPVEINYLK